MYVTKPINDRFVNFLLQRATENENRPQKPRSFCPLRIPDKFSEYYSLMNVQLRNTINTTIREVEL